MTTAKPHQTAGQSDSADDLIAELAKLMAQDAQTERPAPVARSAAPALPPASTAPSVSATPPVSAPPVATPTIRIPGVASEPQPAMAVAPPVPRFEFAPAPQPVGPARQEPAPSRQEPVFAPPTPAAAAPPEPFKFDFDLHAGQRGALPEPRPEQPIMPAEPEPAGIKPEPVPPASADDMHDTIADLIAAELHDDPVPQVQPLQAPVPQAPAPQGQAPQAPTPQAQAPQAAVPAPVQPAAWSAAPVQAASPSQPEPAKLTLRPVNLVPAAKPENDRFRIAPVFGLGTTPPATPAPSDAKAPGPAQQPYGAAVVPTPDARLDPIDEIENLIGRAVRVELDRPAERPAPSPALRSLATPTAPQPAPRQPAERGLSGADEAILAAAAATGAEVGWVNPVDAPEAKPAIQRRGPKERRRRSPGFARAFVGPLVAVALLLVAGFGLYWVLGLGRSEGPAPVLTADTAPVKEVPAAQPNPAQAQQSVVFNEMDGVVPGAEEQLVSRDQADVNEVTRVVTSDFSDEGLANRKVRTVTVRPDGSIVSGEEALAGAAILPVDRPNVPEVAGADAASPSLLASASATQTPLAAAPATPAVIPVVPGSSVPVVDAAGNSLAGKIAPVPYLRPASVGDAPPTGPTSPVNAVIDPVGALIEPAAAATQPIVAAAPPAEARPQTLLERITGGAAPAQQASGDAAPAYVQLSSQRSEEDARTAASQMASRFGSLFGGASLEIQRVDLGERGIYYRVRVPAASLQGAAEICSNVKANGGDCFTM